MSTPTIHDVAAKAGVSLATVDRVLNGRSGVSAKTVGKVNQAVRDIGYLRDVGAANLSRRRRYRLLFILPDGTNAFVEMLRAAVTEESASSLHGRTDISVSEAPAFKADALAEALDGLDTATLDGVAIVAVEAPIVRRAIRRLRAAGLGVVTLVSDLSADDRDGYIGIDNVAAGRTAGSFMQRFLGPCQGKVLVLAGSLVARDHMERRLGFDRVMCERQVPFSVLLGFETLDDPGQARALVCKALLDHPDLIGVYSMGAGSRGLLRALGTIAPSRRPVTIMHELTAHARRGLEKGAVDLVLDQGPAREARTAARMLRAISDRQSFDPGEGVIGIRVFTRENLPAIRSAL